MTVKRYDPEGYDGLSALMRETEYGDRVRGEDYDALLSLNAELLALLEESRRTFEMWKDVAPAVSLCADIDKALAKASSQS